MLIKPLELLISNAPFLVRRLLRLRMAIDSPMDYLMGIIASDMPLGEGPFHLLARDSPLLDIEEVGFLPKAVLRDHRQVSASV